jgi:hypothetical protein
MKSRKKLILIFFFFIYELFGGWNHRSDYFPIISHVRKYEGNLYFVLIYLKRIYIFENDKNGKIKIYSFKLEKEGKFDTGCRANIEDEENKIKIRCGGKWVKFDLKNKSFEVMVEKEPPVSYCEKSKEFLINDTLKIIIKDLDLDTRGNFILKSKNKEEIFPLPPISFSTFKRLCPEHFKRHLEELEDEEEFARFSVFTYTIFDAFLIKNKIWFLIDFYTGEGYEGVGGIGYFDWKRKKFGIARLPELCDFGVASSILIGDRIWIVPVIHYESGDFFGEYLIEFNTKNCKYRVYNFDNTLFRNFGIIKIIKIDNEVVFFTGNEVVILNLENYKWKRFSLFCQVKEDSTPLFLQISSPPKIYSPNKNITIRYARKGEKFFPLYFHWSGEIEVEAEIITCGKTKQYWKIEEMEKMKKRPIWDVLEEPILLENEKFGIVVFSTSPLEKVEKISDSLYNVCVKGAYLELKDLEFIIEKTGEKIIPPPEWKLFSSSPFYTMEKEIEIMKKECEKDTIFKTKFLK